MTPREINDKLCRNVESLAKELFPNGKREGHEWKVGSLSGNVGNSLGVNIGEGGHRGMWSDFATGETGDLLDLVSKVKGLSFPDTLKWCRNLLGIPDDAKEFRQEPAKICKKVLPKNITPEAMEWFNKRMISTAALKQYEVCSTGPVVAFPCYKGKDLYCVKYRDTSKEKAFHAEADTTKTLFGWQAIPDYAREVIITEGEMDALAYATQGLPAMSIPMGAGVGANQNWIEQDYDDLQRFDTIYLSMDMDDAGQKVKVELVKRLGRERCRIVKLPLKDANECLLAGMQLDKFISESEYEDPEELKCATHFFGDVMNLLNGIDETMGHHLPWNKTQDKFRMRDSEVTLWHGWNGSGKSMVLSHILSGLICNEIPVCIASMEMPPKQLLGRMYQQISGQTQPAQTLAETINTKAMPFCWLINYHGSMKGDRILSLFEYAFMRFGCNHFVVDSLTKCGLAEDDYNGQKLLVEKFSDFSHKNKVHTHIVAHDRKGENENITPSKMDIRGSGSISDLVENVINVWRNKPKEERVQEITNNGFTEMPPDIKDKPDCLLTVQKQRNYDFEGKIGLYFNVPSHQYLERSEHKPWPMIKEKRNE
jgi:twinkle protein